MLFLCVRKTRPAKYDSERTVDGNGDALRERVAILAKEGGDLAELIGLEVLNGGLGRVSLDELEVDVVGLRDGTDGRGAGVSLEG